MSGPEAAFWREACDVEMSNLKRNQVYEEVSEDSLPSWDKVKGRATELVDFLWVLKKKYNELRQLVKHKARATVRGDQEAKVDTQMGLPPAETFAPTVRHNTLKLLIAAGVVRAAKAEGVVRTAEAEKSNSTKGTRFRSFDVTAAFLQGKPLDDRARYIRPPQGYRQFDRRGVAIVWKLMGNCYGRGVAPRVWHQTAIEFMLQPESEEGLGMQQSDADPCYLFKVYADGSRLDMGLYVDDSWCCDNAGSLADADLAKFAKRFQITLDEDPKHFLGMNVHVHSPTRVTLSSEAYILSMADRYVPDWRSRPKLTRPCTEKLLKAYDAAHERGRVAPPDQVKRYMGKVGALVYTSPCVRADACATISRLGRALTFPSDELESCADDCMVYLAQTASVGVTFDGHASNADVLYCESDSDWAVGHSTTGWACYFGGAAFAYSSKRQACIALSSTEAEIIAASACAVELVHFRRLLAEMGFQQATSPQFVDNSGAVELSRDRKSCHRSRHVDRRYFKVRELAFEGELRVEHIDTKLNSADLLTKPLEQESFDRHRARLLNLPEADAGPLG